VDSLPVEIQLRVGISFIKDIYKESVKLAPRCQAQAARPNALCLLLSHAAQVSRFDRLRDWRGGIIAPVSIKSSLTPDYALLLPACYYWHMHVASCSMPNSWSAPVSCSTPSFVHTGTVAPPRGPALPTTYVYGRCNICNIQIKHLQHTFKTVKIFKTCV
jgi:hypothetical protein